MPILAGHDALMLVLHGVADSSKRHYVEDIKKIYITCAKMGYNFVKE